MIDTKNFKGIIDTFYNQLISTSGKMADLKLSEDKWSLKEIIGHLIDSASNNHQRFVRLQFGDLLDFPAYKGEEWVKTQRYNGMDWEAIISLWHNYNLFLLHVIENINEEVFGNVWVKDEETTITLEYMINGYYVHIESHAAHFKTRKEEILVAG